MENKEQFDGIECELCKSGRLKFDKEFTDLHVDTDFYQCDNCDRMFPVVEDVRGDYIDWDDYQN